MSNNISNCYRYSRKNKETSSCSIPVLEKYMVSIGLRMVKIKWINYPTKVKHIYVRLYADHKIAKVMIELQHKDEEIRGLFEQLTIKTAFETWLVNGIGMKIYKRHWTTMFKDRNHKGKCKYFR